MAKGATLLSNLLVLVLLCSSVFVNEARLLKAQNSIDEMEIMKVLDGLYVDAVKTGGGPSRGGGGHEATNRALTLEGIKKSGPSPGAGN